MKPRIFVSSTFYDLKHIREDLSNFIKIHDFEPIMFEDGDIGYTPGKPLDNSCYDSMKGSDMVLLVIGGQYGSAATGEEKDKFKEYISITRNEFRTAVNAAIPVYAFIDRAVYAEFRIYEANYSKIEKDALEINFAVTKDINVFRFIKEIKGIGNIVITEFVKVADIKDFLSKQWSDMFKRYLENLKSRKTSDNVSNSVEELRLITRRMNVMLNEVGKQILSSEDSNGYEEVVEKQEIVTIASKIADSLKFSNITMHDSKAERESVIRNILHAIEVSDDIEEYLLETDLDEVEEKIGKTFNNLAIKYIDINISKDIIGIKEFIKNDSAKAILIDELMKNEYYQKLIWMDK